MNKEQKITGNITPPNKNLDILKQNFPNCFDKNGGFDFEKFKTLIQKNEINFSKESYGMDWLGKSYARLLATDETTTLLKEDETHNQKDENKNAENLLLKGDNLEVLKHLSNAYYEKIKMIYIDPPYNTGSDGFVYADDRKFDVPTLMELSGVSEERAKRILAFTQSKSNSHSAWLTFMYPRLYIAKQLLKEDGVIFISIDDNEVAQLRLLMDEIFGEENFVGELIWKRRSSSALSDNNVSIDHEYVLSYHKGKLKDFKGENKDFKAYKNPDKDKRGDWVLGDLTVGMNESMRPNQAYKLVDPKTKKEYSHNPNRVWAYIPESMDNLIKEGRIFFPNDTTKRPMLKRFKNELKSIYNPFSSLMLKNVGLNTEATKQIQALFGTSIFEYSKPISLLRNLTTQVCAKEDVILDFFAGSGTTGDAVMQLNAADGSNRKYILVQLPEVIDSKSNKTAYDFVKNELNVEEPTIFEITKERLIRAAKKINTTIDQKNKDLNSKIETLKTELETPETKEAIQQLQLQINQNHHLKTQNHFKVFETMPIWEDYELEANALLPDLELFDESQLTTADLQALLVTWKTYDGILLTQPLQETDLNGYTAHYGQGKLYLMDKGFTSNNLKTLLEKIDHDKDFNPTVVIAFGYHFETKNLLEISENMKSYANKKSIDIDFITRY